jgi:hypothetical protein
MMGKNYKNKYERKGTFFMFHHEIFESDAFRSLNCTARSLLFELLRHYKPSSELVFLSVRVAGERLKVHPDTAAKAFSKLSDRGFIVLTSHALWQQRISRVWRLTWMSYKGLEPTDDWRVYKKAEPKKRDSLPQSKGQTALKEAAQVDE